MRVKAKIPIENAICEKSSATAYGAFDCEYKATPLVRVKAKFTCQRTLQTCERGLVPSLPRSLPAREMFGSPAPNVDTDDTPKELGRAAVVGWGAAVVGWGGAVVGWTDPVTVVGCAGGTEAVCKKTGNHSNEN